MSTRSEWWLQCTVAHKWRDYWERRSKLHRKGSIFSHCRTHCQCCKQRFEAIWNVLSNGTDVAMYTLAYFHVLKTTNVNKIWVNFGIQERQRHIPVYQLPEILGTERLRELLKAHSLTKYDVTSKTGSKLAACKACPEKHLYDFGEDGRWQKSTSLE